MSMKGGLVFFVLMLFVLAGFSALEGQQSQSNGYIYWAEHYDQAIGRAALDGSSVADPQFIILPPSSGPTGIAVNDKYIYWTNFGMGTSAGSTISRADLNGNITDLVFISGCLRPMGLAIDNNYIYWSNAEPANTIGRANLDGTNPDQYFIRLSAACAMRGITVSGDSIYWANYDPNRIGRANLDGTGVNENFITDCTNSPHGVTVTESHVYWTNAADGTIGWANIDGTNPEILIGGLQIPIGIAPKGDHLYWAEHLWSAGIPNMLGWSNLDGTDPHPDWILPNSSCYMIAITPDSYAFEGFFSPIDNTPTVNKANAGQTIPVKWRITDKNGLPVSDPASFKGTSSYAVSCGELSGDPVSAVEEYAAGSSGLTYLGDGNWQFNWKTPKTYAGQCRIMVLTLADGSTHSANFSFK